jgi:prepilin peptidase CpaA
MNWFALENWPLWVVCLAMVVAAVIDGWKLKVPNKLTFPLILGGWVLGVLYDLELLPVPPGTAEPGWRFLGSFGCSFLGFALLYGVYVLGAMGAGDVKMQMGFGAWIGAYYGWAQGCGIVLGAFCVAVLAGGVIALGMILIRRQFAQNARNVREIVGDWLKSGSLGDVAEKAAQRKPRMHLLPYGIPLCIGFLSYVGFIKDLDFIKQVF